jgi:hypothetical protein
MPGVRVLLLAVLVLVQLSSSRAEFGVPKKTTADATLDADGRVEMDGGSNYMEMATRLQSLAPISIQDAIDIAVVLQAAQADEDTKLMISKLKNDESETLAALAKEVTAMEIVQGLKQSLDELKAIEQLFVDPKRAVKEMDEEGLIEKSRLDFYKQNPEALADETRKGVYFGFVSMAVAGGFLA